MSLVRRSLRSAPAGLIFLLALAHCSGKTGGSGGSGGHDQEKVGSPCVPRYEYDPRFPGFDVARESLETGALQCGRGVCLVNHFQGRVSCPQGQATTDIQPCSGLSDTSCGAGAKCVEAQTLAPQCTCDPTKPGDCDAACSGVQGTSCDPKLKVCGCHTNATVNGIELSCALADPSCHGTTCLSVLKSYLCHKPGNCQSAGAADNGGGKQCCIPGTDTPTGVPVCGQCDASSHRDAADAVYCSCRCGPPEGAPADPAETFCGCPIGFECSEIRKDLGVGDPRLAGKYCIKTGSAYAGSSAACGLVKGYDNPGMCAGLGAGGP